MSIMEKLLIIGHFGGDTDSSDGQTVKTKILYSELCRTGKWEILKADTYYKRNNPLKLVRDSLCGILQAKSIIVLLSFNGMKLYFPILYLFSKLFGKHIYHDVIGGKLPEYVQNVPGFRKYVKSFRHNWVETPSIRDALVEAGVTNCSVIPNFKNLSILCENELKVDVSEPFRFCTFSRVMKEKGIGDAVQVIEKINAQAGRTVCELDIYGYVDDSYAVEFEKLMAGQKASRYCGVVPFDKSVEAIRDYYALLFPTYWKGEGFPGTLVDALSAGLPIVASDWNFNKDIVRNGATGVIYPSSLANDLETAVIWMMGQKENLIEFKRNCIQDAAYYRPEQHIQNMIEMIQNNQ